MSEYQFQDDTIKHVIGCLNKNTRYVVADEVGMGKTHVAKGVILKMLEQSEKDTLKVVYMTSNAMVLKKNLLDLSKGINAIVYEQDRFADLYKTNQKSIATIASEQGRDKRVDLYSVSTGIIFGTHSAFGTDDERTICCEIINQLELDQDVKAVLKAMIFAGSYYGDKWKLEDDICEWFKKYKRNTYFSIPLQLGEKEYISERLGTMDVIGKIKRCYAFAGERARGTLYESIVREGCIDDTVRNDSIIRYFYNYLDDLWKEEFQSYKKNQNKEEQVKKVAKDICDVFFVPWLFGCCFQWYEGDSDKETFRKGGFDLEKATFVSEINKEIGSLDIFGKSIYDLKHFERCKVAFQEVREVLNLNAIRKIEPDLIILDEFHRYFRKAEITGIEKILAESEKTKLLMLSATPYRMDESIAFRNEEELYQELLKLDNDADGDNRKESIFSSLGDLLYYVKNGVLYEDRIGLDTDDIKQEYDNKMRRLQQSIRGLTNYINQPEEFENHWEEAKDQAKKISDLCLPYMARTERFRALEGKLDYIFKDTRNDKDIENYIETYAKREADMFRLVKEEPVKGEHSGKRERFGERMNYCLYTPYPLSFGAGLKAWSDEERKMDIPLIRFSNNASDFFWDGKPYVMGRNLRMDQLMNHVLVKAKDSPDEEKNEELTEKVLWIPPIRSGMSGKLGGWFQKLWEQTEDDTAKGSYTKTLVFTKYKSSSKAIAAVLSETMRGENISGIDEEIKRQIDEFQLCDLSNAKEVVKSWNSQKKICEESNETQVENLLQELSKSFRQYFTDNWIVLKRAGVGQKNTLCDEEYTLLDYCEDGCLLDVLDEYQFLLDKKCDEQVDSANSFVCHMRKVLEKNQTGNAESRMKSRVDYLTFDEDEGRLKETNKPVICSYAETYSTDNFDSGDVILSSFNSPFYPFVLVSTPVVQEGVDLHFYCHQLMHWNMTISPIAFEQKEGRINRYHGHLIRKRIAADLINSNHANTLEKEACLLETSWDDMLKYADPGEGSNAKGLIPHWYYMGNEMSQQYHFKRILAFQPFESKDQRMYDILMLKKSLYRMSMGLDMDLGVLETIQTYIEKLNEECSVDHEGTQYRLEDIMINLSPAFSPVFRINKK